MKDPLSKQQRSALMAKVRHAGNKSTEIAVQATLRQHGIVGWRKHPRTVPGRPDFYFPRIRLAVFVDGCFWHSCPKCGRIPKTRVKFWTEKIVANRGRDDRTRRKLWRQGYAVMRIWEHDLKGVSWFTRLAKRIRKSEKVIRWKLIRLKRKRSQQTPAKSLGPVHRPAETPLSPLL